NHYSDYHSTLTIKPEHFGNVIWSAQQVEALKKAVAFAVAYDDAVSADCTISWKIARASVSAVWDESGDVPALSLSSENVPSDLVVYTFKDKETGETVSANSLLSGHSYEVTATLNPDDPRTANYAFTAPQPYELSIPEAPLTLWQKIVNFLTATQLGLPVWAWIVIAVVSLILLVLIIVLGARAAKKKREREEQRRLEEKAERERREEREEQRRREEREERMARLNQQQAMPQMMMPQMMPQMMGGQMPMQQSMPQTAQSMATGGGASSSEIAELKAEILALKTAQESAKEIAELKAENAAMKAEQNAVLRSDVNALRGGEQVIQGGISIDKLTEIIRTEVNNALDNRAKAAAQPATADNGAAPAATQVPPDAVMTTVTTTKIDTTKKPAQAADRAAAPAPVRTVVRNVVAPMPVDDGRVFDVGGFYTPADPITDMGFTDDENKE
ncbi:MAG: hypothetical protein K2H78_02465, partial [Clostridia bacterium]|nr:hypothetical protein [Clostridia bacterium]